MKMKKRLFILVASLAIFTAPLARASSHLTRARAWALQKRAEAGNAQALTEIRNAADQGDPAAEVDLGGMYETGKGLPHDGAQSVKWFRKAAEQGNGEAAYAIAGDYLNGINLPRNSSEGVQWLQKAAEDGSAIAEYLLGSWYEYGGTLVPANPAKGLMWLRKSAAQGFSGFSAQMTLGEMYFKGHHVKQNYVEAAKWYRLAAKEGFSSPELKLGMIYCQGVTPDYMKAYKWFSLSKDDSCPTFPNYARATRLMAMLTPKLTATQIAEANREASEWLTTDREWLAQQHITRSPCPAPRKP